MAGEYVVKKEFKDYEVEDQIDGFDVWLSVTQDGDDIVSSCHVIKGEYSNSFGVVEDWGVIENEAGDEIKVPFETVREIRHWAEENGY
jgi:hypothetical protein